MTGPLSSATCPLENLRHCNQALAFLQFSQAYNIEENMNGDERFGLYLLMGEVRHAIAGAVEELEREQQTSKVAPLTSPQAWARSSRRDEL